MQTIYAVYSRHSTASTSVNFSNLADAEKHLSTKEKDYMLVSFISGNFSRTMKVVKQNWKW